MNDRRPYSLLQIRELGHGVHDLPGFDTSYVRLFAVRLGSCVILMVGARSADEQLLHEVGARSPLRGECGGDDPRPKGGLRAL